MGLSMSIIAAVEAKQSVLAAGMVDVDLSLVFMLALFLTFAVLLHFLVMKPLLKAHEARHAQITGGVEGVGKIELQIAELRIQHDKGLAEARQAAVAVRDARRKEAQAEAQVITAEAQSTHAAKLLAQKRDLDAAAAAVRAELGGHANTMADALTTKLLGGKA